MTDSTTTQAMDLEALEPRAIVHGLFPHQAAALCAEIRSLREEVAKLKAAPAMFRVTIGIHNAEIMVDQKAPPERHPIEMAARAAVRAAIVSGRLSKGPCEVCFDSKAEAHHDDYSKPLEVRWLCAAHHKEWHRTNGKAINAK